MIGTTGLILLIIILIWLGQNCIFNSLGCLLPWNWKVFGGSCTLSNPQP